MAANIGTRWDVQKLINVIFHTFGGRIKKASTSTCDGLILKMHYQWTFFALFANFLMVWYQWYHRDVITCVSHFNADAQVRVDYINTCLSYPYLVKQDFHEDNDGEFRNFIVAKGDVAKGEESRRYILFYRWISWSFLLLAGIYYIPRKVSKSFEHPKTRELIELIAKNSMKIDNTEQQINDLALRYVHTNMKTHNGLYYKYIIANVIALFVDIFAFIFLDFLLQGRFIALGFNAFPYQRDPVDFSDHISQTFPPFAYCEIGKAQMLVGKGRNEKLGCHLTFMELYEKFFIVLWFWLIMLTTITSCYIVYLLTLHFPFVQKHILRTAKPAHGDQRLRDIVPALCQNCKVGDIFLLDRLKQHLSHTQFYKMMVVLSRPEMFKKPERAEDKTPPGVTNDLKDKLNMNNNPELRHRKNVDHNQVNELLNLLDGERPHHMPNSNMKQGASNQQPQGPQGGMLPRQQQQPRPQQQHLPQNSRQGPIDPRLIQHHQNSATAPSHTAILLESDD
ncbi:unnamed protein product [Meganyctiphanes norvegica]|uniref:Innexin n=1 Tax=Meganyctiphanes norvegica TaxID=48144 RepID=A0AAV2PJ99_MEGNR